MDTERVVRSLNVSEKLIQTLDEKNFQTEVLEKALNEIADPLNRGEIFWPLRVALSGRSASPGPFEIMAALGKAETLRRIKFALGKFKND